MCIKRTFNRYILYSAILTTLLLCALTYTDYVKKHFPEHIYITEQSNTTFNLSVPVTGNVYNSSYKTDNNINANFNEEVTFITGNPASYDMDLKLFGVIFLKTVHVNVVDETKVYPCGFQAGLYLKSNGILVVKTDSVSSMSYGDIIPCEHILSKGDYILYVNGTEISSKKEFSDIIAGCDGSNLELGILRNGSISTVKVTAFCDSNG